MVHRIYGVALRFRSGGAPLALHPAFGGRNYGTPSVPNSYSSANAMLWMLPQAGLNVGLQWIIEDARRDPWTRIIIFSLPLQVGDSIAHTIHDASMEVRFPGFHPADVHFDCQRLSHGIEIITIELDPVGEGFGSVVMEYDARHEVALLANASSRLIFKMTGTSDEFDLFAQLADRGPSTVRWDGVPAGRYQIGFAADYSMQPFPVQSWTGGEREIEVAAGVETKGSPAPLVEAAGPWGGLR